MIELPDDILIKINGYIKTKCIVCNKNMLLNKFKYKICCNYCWCIFWFGNVEIIFLSFLMGCIFTMFIFYYY